MIEHREALIFLLYQAAEIEHGSMCQYLYAAFSLRRTDDPGLTSDQCGLIEGWRATVNAVASEEMLHCAGGQPAHGDRCGAELRAPAAASSRAALSPRSSRGAAAVLRASLAPLPLPGASRRGRARRLDRRGGPPRRACPRAASDVAAGDRATLTAVCDRRAPLPRDRAGPRASEREDRRDRAVHRTPARTGRCGRLPLGGPDQDHRSEQRQGRARADRRPG